MENHNFRLVYKPYNKKRMIVKIALSSFLIALVITLISAYFLGYRAFVVRGWSSEPDIHYGSLAIDYKIPFEDIKVGDYITASFGGGYVTHRVEEIHIESGYVITRGNSNYNTTETVYEKNFAGKVLFSIDYLGEIAYNIQTMIINNNSVNFLGIFLIIITMVAIIMFSKLVDTPTFYVKEY